MEKRIRKPISAGYVCASNSANPNSKIASKSPKVPHIRVFGKLMRISEMEAERIKNDYNVLYI
jgi:hypothetical protein